MWTPNVSIITQSFHHSRFLAAMLRGGREQNCPQIEHIVVDGRSTDGDGFRAGFGCRGAAQAVDAGAERIHCQQAAPFHVPVA
jgi:hypothetical protein